MPAYKHLLVTQDAPHVAVVTLNRPPVNALSRELRTELTDAFDRLQDPGGTRAIVLAAAGRTFCAGADLNEKAERPEAGGRAAARRLIRETFYSVLGSAKPVIAAVGGGALGAGFVLAACCDVILAADEAFFAMPEIDVGQGGGASFLQRILPVPVMRKMMLTAERVPASELYRLGAVAQVVPAAELTSAAVALASVIAAKSPAAVHAIRTSFGTVEALSVREGFDVEQRYIDGLSSSAEGAAARQAFLSRNQRRRAPGSGRSPQGDPAAGQVKEDR